MKKQPITMQRLEDLGWTRGIADEATGLNSYESHPAWRKRGLTIIHHREKFYLFEDRPDHKGIKKKKSPQSKRHE